MNEAIGLDSLVHVNPAENQRSATREAFESAPLAVTIHFNHEWTRINTNEDGFEQALRASPRDSPDRESREDKPRRPSANRIRVYSCSFVVSTAWIRLGGR